MTVVSQYHEGEIVARTYAVTLCPYCGSHRRKLSPSTDGSVQYVKCKDCGQKHRTALSGIQVWHNGSAHLLSGSAMDLFLSDPHRLSPNAMLNDLVKQRGGSPAARSRVTVDASEKLLHHCISLVEAKDLKRAADIWEKRNGGAGLEGEQLTDEVYRGFVPDRDGGLFNMKVVKRAIKAGKWDGAIDSDTIRTALVSASFTAIAGLASAKLAFDGFTSYTPWSNPIVDQLVTGDFKTVRTASLQMSDFNTPAEGSPFNDLTLAEAGGTGTLAMRGAGIELTKQAIYNDETGIFLDRIKNVGYIGAQHQDKLVATNVEAANFSAATAANAFSQANLKVAWSNMMAVTGPAGEKPGYLPKQILVPSALYLTAIEATTLAPGSTIATPFASNLNIPKKLPLNVVHGLHLSSATTWYMLAGPQDAPAFTFLKHRDYPIPQLFTIDPQLVASCKFRIEYPTQVITNYLNPGTNTKPVGAYKCT